jgi:tRNA threonylcarbamoyladenosine biosynthesis protein TsaB
MTRTEPLILSLETAIGGGSIALVRRKDVIAENDLGTARANVILTAVESILKRTNLQIADVGKLAVSLGPGSFTGIRVGLSTVLGLRRSLNVELVGVSAFEAVAFSSKVYPVAVILPLGRNRFGCQLFTETAIGKEAESSDPFVTGSEHLAAKLAELRPKRTILVASDDSEILEVLRRSDIDLEVINEASLAGIIGRFAAKCRGSGSLDPLYLK